MLDGDGSTDPEEIPRFVEALLAGADFAKGSRFAPGGSSADITGFRHLGNRALRALVNVLFGTDYSDLCYGYNAFWRHCLTHMDVTSHGFEVETLINMRVARAGLKVAEVPSIEHARLSRCATGCGCCAPSSPNAYAAPIDSPDRGVGSVRAF